MTTKFHQESTRGKCRDGKDRRHPCIEIGCSCIAKSEVSRTYIKRYSDVNDEKGIANTSKVEGDTEPASMQRARATINRTYLRRPSKHVRPNSNCRYYTTFCHPRRPTHNSWRYIGRGLFLDPMGDTEKYQTQVWPDLDNIICERAI